MSISRRRFLAVSAAAALAPSGSRAEANILEWKGLALGAEASITLIGLDRSRARDIAGKVEAEISRLEDLFSLYRAQSQLCTLNRTAHLDRPAPEMLDLLSLSASMHATTGGAFDPTVQVLWRLNARHRGRPDAVALAKALALTGWRHVQFDQQSVQFAQSGMALTLNGIAQGYIADRIADLLHAEGLTDVLVDMGEIRALGRRPDGLPWQVGIALPNGQQIGRSALGDRALATSAPAGTVLDSTGQHGHIVDPRTGRSATQWRLVSVSAPSAALADALSTAMCLMDRSEIDACLAHHPTATLEAMVA